MDIEKTGKYIAQKRKEKRLTQKRVADLLNLSSPKTVSKWERGVNAVDISLLLDLANILDVTVNELLMGEDLKTHKKKIKIKYLKIFIIISIFIISFLLIFNYCSYKLKGYEIYHLETLEADYTVDGFLLVNDDEYVLNINSITSNNETDILINELKIYVMYDGETLFIKKYKYDENINLNEALNEVNFTSFNFEKDNVNINLSKNIQLVINSISNNNVPIINTIDTSLNS